MIQTTKNKVILSRETWEELKHSDYFKELIEVIEDREQLRDAKQKSKPEETMSFRDYDRRRRKIS